MKYSKLKLDNKGFTIVELMIATAIFAGVMVVLMFGVIAITHNYYKGLTESKVQDTARNIANDLSESIQLNSGLITQLNKRAAHDTGNPDTSTPEVDAWCIGGQEYDFILGYELESAGNDNAKHQTANATRDTSLCGSQAQDLWTGSGLQGDELLEQNMRLSNLEITQITGTEFYTIDVKVTYGDDDLLSNPTAPSAQCTGMTGNQFCATAEINTTVEKRVQ